MPTANLIDSLTLRMADVAGAGVQIRCPPASTEVGVNFHACVDFTPPDTDVTSCKLQVRTTTIPPTKKTPVPPNEVVWEFSRVPLSVPPDTYTLYAKGNVSAENHISGITVTANGVDPCPTVNLVPSKSMARGAHLKSITFVGKSQVDGNGDPRPLTLSGMVPATFTVGGENLPGQVPPVVELTPVGGGLFNGVALPLWKDNLRWSREFKNVPAGAYFLKVKVGAIDAQRKIIIS